MKRNLVFSFVNPFIFGLATLYVPTIASAQAIAYQAVIQALDTNGNSLGYLTRDPNYYTPLLGSDPTSAITVDFTLPNPPTGTAINFATTPVSGFSYFGLVQGRDSTSPDIALGSFNYLYLEYTNATPPNSTPQNVGNLFTQGSGLTRPSESAVWNVDTGTGALTPAWVNTDGSKPTTQVFIQSNHVYAGGDANAFHARYPAPVTSATLKLQILSAIPLLSITSLTANPNNLWPPNQKMIPVTVTPMTSGGSGAISCSITSVSSNEPVDPNGDWVITGSLTLTLRAERTASLASESNTNGRVYSITVQCTDAANDNATKTTTVVVPFNQGK